MVYPCNLVVSVPVADLRRMPIPAKPCQGKDELQESQLLYGEFAFGFEEKEGWIRVHAIEQQRYRNSDVNWTGYPGWVKKEQVIRVTNFPSNLLRVSVPWVSIYRELKTPFESVEEICLGSKLELIEHINEEWSKVKLVDQSVAFIPRNSINENPALQLDTTTRLKILQLAKHMLGQPYLWGGCSPHDPEKDFLTSVDCSGFTHLLYRHLGKGIPRDAHDQFLKTTPCEFKDLRPADLIFLASCNKADRISHVMLYEINDTFLDANITDGCIVTSTGQARFGRPFNSMNHAENIGEYFIYFGSMV